MTQLDAKIVYRVDVVSPSGVRGRVVHMFSEKVAFFTIF